MKHSLSLKSVLKCVCWMGVILTWLYSTESSPGRVEMRDGGERGLETNNTLNQKGRTLYTAQATVMAPTGLDSSCTYNQIAKLYIHQQLSS